MESTLLREFQRDKVVAEHQVRGDGANELGIDALLTQIDERETVAFGELASGFALRFARRRPEVMPAILECSVVAMNP